MLNQEQRIVVDAPLRGVSMVYAAAGAGKTTSLVHKAQRHAALDGMRGLYVAFAKPAQLDASKRFGSAAICKTGHALAFPRYGQKYVHKLRAMRPFEVIQITGLVDDYSEARLLVDAVQNWCISDEMVFPQRIHLGEMAKRVSPARAGQLSVLAKSLWEQMCDPDSPVPMHHDGYLKLYQLSCPRLPGDYLMVDEFQDTNPVLLDIIRRQRQPVIGVGDPHQSIFAFRGAVNAMSRLSADRELFINQSFRFGPAVADVANALLGGLKQETRKIIGSGPRTEVRWSPEPPQGVESLTVISRTNGGLFNFAVEALALNQSLSFVGGVQSYGLSKLCDVQHMSNGNFGNVRDSFLRSFKSFWQFKEYAEEVEDLELLRLIKTCEEYGEHIFGLVDEIHAKAQDTLDAQRVLTTAHKCKGLTRDHVLLADDFPLLVDEGHLVDPIDEQEVNLAYVAVTRAVQSLTLNATTKDYLAWLWDQGGSH